MKKNFVLLMLGLVISVVFGACQKEGPAGSTGPAGVAGPAGATGAAGPTGTANVIYSAWFSPASWAGTGTANSYFDKAAPGITQDIIDKGVVLSYVKLSGDGSSVRTLPAITSYTVFWNSYILSVGNLRFTCTRTDAAAVNPSTANQFRYVIIPGGVSGGRMASGASTQAVAEELKTKTYEEILERYNIPATGGNAN